MHRQRLPGNDFLAQAGGDFAVGDILFSDYAVQ